MFLFSKHKLFFNTFIHRTMYFWHKEYETYPKSTLQILVQHKYCLGGLDLGWKLNEIPQVLLSVSNTAVIKWLQRKKMICNGRIRAGTKIIFAATRENVPPDIITKTCLYNFDHLKPHFYIEKLGFIRVYIISLISAGNIDCGYSLEPPRPGGSNEYPQSMFVQNYEKYQSFFGGKIFSIFK